MLQVRSPSDQVFQTRFASTGATTAKVPHVFGGVVWLPLNTADAAASNEFVFQAECSGAPKLAGEAWTPGQTLYWDAANTRFTTTAGALPKAGKAVQPALSADTVAPIFLFNTFAT